MIKAKYIACIFIFSFLAVGSSGFIPYGEKKSKVSNIAKVTNEENKIVPMGWNTINDALLVQGRSIHTQSTKYIGYYKERNPLSRNPLSELKQIIPESRVQEEASTRPFGVGFLGRNNPPLVRINMYTPSSSVQFAAGDILTVPEEQRKYMRYLSMYNLSKEDRKKMAQTVAFMVNSLGKRRQMYIPVFVGASDETVLRINIKDYEWKAEVWEEFCKKGSGIRGAPEPYFHSFLQKLEYPKTTKSVTRTVKEKVKKKVPVKKRVHNGYYDHFGKPIYVTKTVYEEREIEEEVKKEVKEEVKGDPILKRIFAPATWVDQDSINLLMQETHSESPIIRADWFLFNVSVPPAYHDFLGLGDKQKDFQNLIFADEELAEKARSQYKAVVVTSSVARNNRTLTRSPTFTNGYYWVSHDTLNSVEDRQYIQNFLNEKFDATEEIGTLPNGLQAYFLTNGAGERQDFAPPDIAVDNLGHDRVVRNGRSCIWCHSSGILPLDDEVRNLTKRLQNKASVRLLITNEEDAYRIQDLFGSNLDEQIVIDQNIYAKAVGLCNGLKPEVNARQFKRFYDEYGEILLTKEIISRELGIPLNDMDKYIKASLDPVILGLLKEPIRAIRRDQWERSFQGMMVLIITRAKGIAPVQPAIVPFNKTGSF